MSICVYLYTFCFFSSLGELVTTHTRTHSHSAPVCPPVSSADLNQSGMKTLEHVAVTVTITHPCRGTLEIVLVCPSGMTSVIGARRVIDRYADTHRLNMNEWTLFLL